jgi:hypothetical protein
MERRQATPQEIAAAKGSFCCTDNVQVDDDALVSEIEGSQNIWVQAWVYVTKESIDGN